MHLGGLCRYASHRRRLQNEDLVILENPLDCVKEFLHANMTMLS